MGRKQKPEQDLDEGVVSSENLIAARLLELFGSKTRWKRGLWNVGTTLALREVVEASEAQNLAHLSLFRRRCPYGCPELLKNDPSLDTTLYRGALVNALIVDGKSRGEVHFEGREYHQSADGIE